MLVGPHDDLCPAQKTASNLDESKVGPTPCPTRCYSSSGRKVRNGRRNGRRSGGPSSCTSFETQVYGKVPQLCRTIQPQFLIESEDSRRWVGTAIRREVSIVFAEQA